MPRGPRISIHRNARAASAALAAQVVEAVAKRPELVLGLPTGRTPLQLYAELVRLHRAGRVDFSRVTTFNLDEFLGVPPTHPGSYRSFMQQHLFQHVNIDARRVHFLDGSATDVTQECEQYERAIVSAGGIDLQILGIGTNGHIGFNEPARSLHAWTHRVRLKPETRRSNAALFGGDAGNVPAEGLSMGMSTILHARSIVLLATGATKARCLEKVVNGPITTSLPASFLQLHDSVEIVLDQAAAAALSAG